MKAVLCGCIGALACAQALGASPSDQGIPRPGAQDVSGVVRGPQGPEAGVWVIAETDGLDTRFARIVVTDDRGRFLIPDLPRAHYRVWVRGYGLTDSAAQPAEAGMTLELAATPAPDATSAAQIYPAAYWYALLGLPAESEVAGIPGGMTAYLMGIKNRGCIGCHQLGQLATRTLPATLDRFTTTQEAWLRRLQSGQAGAQMVHIAMNSLRGVPIRHLAEWSDRIAAGAVPVTAPARPVGRERDVVATVYDWSSPKSYLHDLSGTDRNHPTLNGYGPLYGAAELSTDDLPSFDPRAIVARTFHAPVRDSDTPSSHDDPIMAASPYWGSERIWDSRANTHNPMLDWKGRVWYTARIRASVNPPFCRRGSSHPSAKMFPTASAQRQLAVYEPRTGRYSFVDTCFSTHHLQFADDAHHTLWTSGGNDVIGWLDASVYDANGDAAAAQHWAPVVLDTNGNGRLDAWTEPGKPGDPNLDRRLDVGIYAVMPDPTDGSVWGTVLSGSGALLRFDPRTKLSEIYNVPLPGYGIRGADIDRHGAVWASLASGHLGRFERRKCKGRLQGPAATGDHCPEGWSFFRLPGPSFAGREAESVEASYYTWVDQHDTLGLGENVPIATGNLMDGVHALVRGGFLTLRIPYPLGFYAKGMEGRIDDPRAGWKGRGIWVTSGDRTPWLKEGGKGTKPLLVHFQVRPDPLAR